MAMSIEKFRRSTARMRAGKGRSARYPAEARQWAVKFAQGQLSRGQALSAVSGQLGVSDMTLRSWLYAASREPTGSLCEVVVAEPEPPVSPARVTVTTRGGHVVTGLDADEAAALLRALG